MMMMRRRRRRRRRRIEIWWGKGVFHDGIPPEAGAPHTHTPIGPVLGTEAKIYVQDGLLVVVTVTHLAIIPFLLQVTHYLYRCRPAPVCIESGDSQKKTRKGKKVKQKKSSARPPSPDYGRR
jgi:hypothetical protein